MDPIELDLKRKKAGGEYLDALTGLGLRVNALLRMYDLSEQRFVLALATELFDFKGPHGVSNLLFKAYNASATPKEIDPFIVRLHSPEHSIIRAMSGYGAADPDCTRRYGLAPEQSERPPAGAVFDMTFDDLRINTEWVCRFNLP